MDVIPTYIPTRFFIPKEMPLTEVPEGSRDIPHTAWGGPCRAAARLVAPLVP